MKTYLTAIILMIACQHTFAQSTDKLFEMFRNEQGADYVKVSPLMMKVAQLFTSDQSTESRFIKGIKSAQVLDLEECDTATKERFKKQAAELELKGYETLFVAKEDGETVKMLCKSDEKNIRELLVFTLSEEDCGVIWMKGKIKKDDIAVIISDDKVMINGRK